MKRKKLYRWLMTPAGWVKAEVKYAYRKKKLYRRAYKAEAMRQAPLEGSKRTQIESRQRLKAIGRRPVQGRRARAKVLLRQASGPFSELNRIVNEEEMWAALGYPRRKRDKK